jgi:hypothetical protein
MTYAEQDAMDIEPAELIPPAKRHFVQVGMAPGHLALYSVVRREALRQLAQVTSTAIGGQIDFLGARKSVMRYFNFLQIQCWRSKE